jgi:hypothetical protein
MIPRHSLFLVAALVVLALAAKPKQKGLVPGTIASFQENSNEEMLLYYDFDRDQKYFRLDSEWTSSPKASTATQANPRLTSTCGTQARKNTEILGLSASAVTWG